MLKLVLFDIDGTLIRTGGAGVKAFARAFQTEFGIADGTEKLKFAGRTDISLVREFFLHNGIEPTGPHFERFFKTYIHWLERIILECESEICPGVPGFLRELRTLPHPPVIGLLTGNIQRGARIKLMHLKLWDEFPFGGFADDHEERDCIAAIAKKRGLDLAGQLVRDKEVLVIGDTPLDIRCARAINARVLAVATGGSTVAELENHKPDFAVEDLQSISVEKLCAT
jgi:phosphoglycolate phosphatase